jgi:hypothetical protein
MRTFIQLKDEIGWASINTTGEIEGAIEVESGTGDFYIKKKYKDGVWLEADIIKFAEINEEGSIIEIHRTYFSSEVNGPIINLDTKNSSRWIDGKWVNPSFIEPVAETVEPATQTVEPAEPGEPAVETVQLAVETFVEPMIESSQTTEGEIIVEEESN